MSSQPIVSLCGVGVRQDAEGRYSLNDLHKAAKAAGKATQAQRPAQFLRTGSVQAFVQTLTDAQKSASVVSVRGGKGQGSYGVELVAIRYAAWIDPAFEVEVYSTFQAARKGEIELAEGRASRQAARLEAPFMTDAVKHQRTAQGKDVNHYHFSNEFNLINRIALGMTAKQYRAEHGLSPNDAVRDTMTPCEIKCIEHLQRVNASLIDIGMPYEERKARLNQIYIQRHAAKLCAEVQRLEA